MSKGNKQKNLSADILVDIHKVDFSYYTGKHFFSKKPKKILRNISFDIRKNETLGILGRNGAGKSSLLRLIAGIMEPDSGIITRNCETINILSIELGFMEQLSGRENIFLSGMLNGFSKTFIESKYEEILSYADIGNAIRDPLVTYSSGMRARLGFSISHFLKPDVLLIDEILGVGDIEFQRKSEAAMKDKMHQNNTIVLVTHDAALVKEVCNRAVVIENGEVQFSGDTESTVDFYLDMMLANS